MIRDTSQIEKQTLWQDTAQINKKIDPQKTIIILGDQNAGKTTLIKIMKGDLEFETKPTSLIQYNYNKKINKNIIHQYQIANLHLQTIISILINQKNWDNIYFFICFDLTNTINIISRINCLLQIIRKQSKIVINKYNLQSMEVLNIFYQIQKYKQIQQVMFSNYNNNQDKQIIKLMPFKTIIIGCKYDIFEKQNIQNKKWITRTLRFISHTNGCNLCFSSYKNLQLCAQIRNIINNFLFEQKVINNEKDYNKPIYIKIGTDYISQMSLPYSQQLTNKQILQKQLNDIFPQKIQKNLNNNYRNQNRYKLLKINNLISDYNKIINKEIRNIEKY